MKTKLLYLFYFSLISLGIKSQTVTFPDPNLKSLLLMSSSTKQIAKDQSGNWIKIDANNDGEIQQTEADNISWLFAGEDPNYNYHIQSLEGIKSFRNLTELRIGAYPQLTTVDLSGMSSLLTLVMRTSASSVNVSGLTQLKSLDCSSNQLTTLDVSSLTQLETLIASHGKLSSLILPTSGQLKSLDINSNNLTTLDVSQHTQLAYLSCSYNKISNLNLSGLNHLERLEAEKNGLSLLTLSGCNKLEMLYCSNNLLTALDISNKPDLKQVYSSFNLLQNINIANSGNIEYLSLYDNKITGSLDLSSLTAVLGVDVRKNLMTKLDASNGIYNSGNGSNNYLYVSDNPNLETIIFKNISQEGIFLDGILSYSGFSALPALKYICCDENWVTAFSQSLTNQQIKKVMVVTDCNFSLNCTQNIYIPDPHFKQYLVENFDFNNDGEICTSEAEKVTYINCPNLAITTVEGLENFKNTVYLNISNNQISNLNIGNLKQLITLDCTYNTLNSLDASANTKLQGLTFNNNPSLQSLLIKNGSNQYIAEYESPTEIYSDYTFLNTNIQYICADDSEVEMVNAILTHEGKTAIVNSNCSPSNNYTLSVSEKNNTKKNNAQIFPNPTQGEISVNADSKILRIEIYDVQGRMMQKISGNDSQNVKVSLQSSPSGLYTFNIITERGTLVKKVMKN